MNDEEWKLLYDGLNRLGKLTLEKYGVCSTFHHHMGTVVQTVRTKWRLMAETDPAYVSLFMTAAISHTAARTRWKW